MLKFRPEGLVDLSVVGLQAASLLIWAKTWAYNHLGPLAGLKPIVVSRL